MNANSLPESISVDEFLTQVTIYWITNTMSSSSRIYYEFKEEMKKSTRVVLDGVKVPFGVSAFPNELTNVSDNRQTVTQLVYINLILYSIVSQGMVLH
jgi:hypothetical protein